MLTSKATLRLKTPGLEHSARAMARVLAGFETNVLKPVVDFELGLDFSNFPHPNQKIHRIVGLVVELLKQPGAHVWVADAPN